MSSNDKINKSDKPTVGLICHEKIPNNQITVIENLIKLIGDDFNLVCVTSDKANIPKSFFDIDVCRIKIPFINVKIVVSRS